MHENWTPSRLRAYIRDRWPDAGAPSALAWAIAQGEAGMTVAVYECAIMARDGQYLSLLLPADHATPPDELPASGGPVAWPFHLVAVCRPEDDAVVLEFSAAGRR